MRPDSGLGKGVEMADLEKLLAVQIDEEHFFLEAHQTRIYFYSSIIAAVIGGAIAGAIRVENRLIYLLLLVGPLIVFILAHLGRRGTMRFYRRYLESVFTRAMIEQALGLTKPLSSLDAKSDYWVEESFIPQRFIRTRKECSTSDAFVNKRLNMGYQKATNQLFYAFQAIAVLMALGLILIYLRSR
jgi:hypothetical protein